MSFDTLSKLDAKNNNGLMQVLIQQPDAVAGILNEMVSFSKKEKAIILTQKNNLGLNALSVAATYKLGVGVHLKIFAARMKEYYGETVDASAQKLYDSLTDAWELYKNNPSNEKLEQSFELALEKAQPLFNEVDDNGGIFKTLARWVKNFISIFVTVNWEEETYDNMKNLAKNFKLVKSIATENLEVVVPSRVNVGSGALVVEAAKPVMAATVPAAKPAVVAAASAAPAKKEDDSDLAKARAASLVTAKKEAAIAKKKDDSNLAKARAASLVTAKEEPAFTVVVVNPHPDNTKAQPMHSAAPAFSSAFNASNSFFPSGAVSPKAPTAPSAPPADALDFPGDDVQPPPYSN